MSRDPRLWLYVAGGWLLLGGLAHLTWHVWGVVMERDTAAGLRAFAMNAMKQAQSPDPLRPTLWRVYRLYSASLALLWTFAGLTDVVMAAVDAPRRILASLSLLQTVFWTAAFVPFAFMDPVIQPLAVVAVAVPLHGIAYVLLSGSAGNGKDDGVHAVAS
ncbi:MAG: hypothetical protein R3304_07810 [Longimicrobiales bacterium]|nr:hypothetical protein [Longimicrobiales bacterium]